MTAIGDLRASVAFFTALPVGGRSGQSLRTAPAALPLVGLILGGILLGIDTAASWLLPAAPASALVVVALAVLTGALHLDGMADTMDGLMGGRNREQRLSIMDDSRNGAFGFSAVAAVLLLKWAFLIPLSGTLRIGALLAVPALARAATLLALFVFPAARQQGMAAEARSQLDERGLALSLGLSVALAAALFWPGGLLLVAAACLIAVLIGWYALRRIGGITGDVLGAIVEICEVVVLLLAATSVERSWLT